MLRREWATRGGRLGRSDQELESGFHAVTHGLSGSDIDALLQHLDAVHTVLTLMLKVLSSERVSRSQVDKPDLGTPAVAEPRWGGAADTRTSARPGDDEELPTPTFDELVDRAASFDHSEAVRLALGVAADALSLKRGSASRGREPEIEIGGVEPQRVDADEAERQMSARTRPGDGEELLTSNELAARIGLKTRQSVHDWLRKGRILGWRGAKRGYLFPAQQVDERGRPLDGIERIVPRFGDGYAAWVWLTTPLPSLDGTKPLVLLRRGETNLVAAAAEGDKQGDFA